MNLRFIHALSRALLAPSRLAPFFRRPRLRYAAALMSSAFIQPLRHDETALPDPLFITFILAQFECASLFRTEKRGQRSSKSVTLPLSFPARLMSDMQLAVRLSNWLTASSLLPSLASSALLRALPCMQSV